MHISPVKDWKKDFIKNRHGNKICRNPKVSSTSQFQTVFETIFETILRQFLRKFLRQFLTVIETDFTIFTIFETDLTIFQATFGSLMNFTKGQ